MARGLHLGPIVAVALLVSLPGCLAKSYEIPSDELQRLVDVPPMERGQAVHVVQQFSTAPELRPAPAWASAPAEATSADGQGEPQSGDAVYAPYEPSGPPVYVFIMPPLYMGFGPPTYVARQPLQRGAVAGGGFSSAGVGGGATAARGDAKGAATALIAAAVAVALVATIGIAASEGARYDGIVAIHPHHPVHLLSAGGRERLIGLDELTRFDLDPRATAVISAEEGAGLWQRGRAPLDRQGFTWQFGGGWMMQQVAADRALSGYVFHMNFGGFFTQTLGAVLTFDVGGASDPYTPGDMWFARYGADLIWLPIHLGLWHFGPRVGGGMQYINTGGGDWAYLSTTQPFLTFGVESEIAMTTRLAFSVRAGGLLQPGTPWANTLTPAVQLGLNIY